MQGSHDLRYWLLLQSIDGMGPALFNRLLARFKEPRAIFSATPEDLSSIPRLPTKIAKEIISSREKVAEMEGIFTTVRGRGFNIVICGDDNYPQRLRKLKNPPPILYVFGNLGDEKCIGIVGARKASRNGLESASYFAKELAQKGFTIVSGYAKGVDTYAAIGAIGEGGKTIMVLPTGVLNYSLHQELRGLRNELLARGTVISEFFPTAKWTVGQAMARNRITSGLSDAVVVVEAGEKGGTINTAEWAKKQGIPLFVSAPLKTEGDKKLVEMGGILVKEPLEIITSLNTGNS